ncbi:hypothetical protein [Bradyrhizobium tropiciagri]|uniref:hypothetical protein n=1 Tax=Bradyrhizobium tropiciagri TaxID=312253 RepID=UPI00067C3C5C|nr:hypothetical protein [Bradyrhizobium tropiciagri]
MDMTTLPALRANTAPEPRLQRLEFAGRERGLTRRHFILGGLSLAASQMVSLLDKLQQLPLLRIRFP